MFTTFFMFEDYIISAVNPGISYIQKDIYCMQFLSPCLWLSCIDIGSKLCLLHINAVHWSKLSVGMKKFVFTL